MKFDMESEMDQSVNTTVARRTVRDAIIDTIEYVDSLPLIKPRWAALDVAVLVLLFLR